MPRYYCDYCDAYLTHDSPVVRKQHNSGYKHKANVKAYYMHFQETEAARVGGPPMRIPPYPQGLAPRPPGIPGEWRPPPGVRPPYHP